MNVVKTLTKDYRQRQRVINDSLPLKSNFIPKTEISEFLFNIYNLQYYLVEWSMVLLYSKHQFSSIYQS